MKAKELRIGNYVCFENDEGKKREAEVIYLRSDDDKVLPIPLTEEWLLKFGFIIEAEKNGQSAILENFRLWRGDNWKNWVLMIGGENDDNNEFFITIEFIHHLQNLYFALTGEELTIK